MLNKEKFGSKSFSDKSECLIVNKYALSAKADEYAQMAWPHLSESEISESFYSFVSSLIKKYVESFENKDIKPICLEVGFGSGRILHEMYKCKNVGQIIGIESSPVMLQKSKEILSQIIPASCPNNGQTSYGISNIELKIGDIQSISFPDESFNIVVSINILDRIANTSKGISELVRVLRPFGSLIIVTACDYENNTPPEQRFTPKEIEQDFIAHGCHLTEKHITELLKNVGGINKKFNEFVYVFNKYPFGEKNI